MQFRNFLEYVNHSVGTEKWCVATKLTERLRDSGYDTAINPMHYHKLCAESPVPLIRFCDILRAKRATPEKPFIATGSSELAIAEHLERNGLLCGQGDGLLPGVSQTFVGVR